MRASHLILFLFVCSFSFSQIGDYEKGKILDRIPVKGLKEETFQLYLPESYDPNTLSAIVIIFDPSGNGTKGIKPFITSAERFNYILVCSNNTKNGPYQENFDYTNRLFSHIFSSLKIDQNQIYTAGFSGGSRLACAVAVLTGAIQGVIACGAGFPNEIDKNPSLESKFSYVGLVGDEDMNYQEMLQARDWLNKFNIENELFTYEDGHSWPPKEQIERAFMWLEIQASKRKLRKPDVKLIQEFYKEDLAIADSLSEDQVFRSVMEYERIMRNYPSNKNIEVVSDKINSLKKSKKYREEIKIHKRIATEEQNILSKLLNRLLQEANYGESRDNFAWWRKELKELNEEYIESDDYFKRKLGKRTQFRLKATANESSMMQRNTKRLDRAIYCDKLLVQINPEEPWTYYRLAETYAMNNDAKNARANLELAIEKGFEHYDIIKKNSQFSKFKNDKKFTIFLRNLDSN